MNIQHLRNDEAITYKWGFWHSTVFLQAVYYERFKKNADFKSVNGKKASEYTEDDHKFMRDYYDWRGKITITEDMEAVDKTDGEVVTILKGDEISIW